MQTTALVTVFACRSREDADKVVCNEQRRSISFILGQAPATQSLPPGRA